MNIVEKILTRASGKKSIRTGEIIEVVPDLVMNHDGDNVYNIRKFRNEFKCTRVKSPEKIIMGLDHNVPANSASTAEVHACMRKFAAEQEVAFYDCKGVMHQLMIENHLKPYQLVFAADSHACSYGSVGALGVSIGTTDNAYLWATGKSWICVPEVFRIRITGKPANNVYAKDMILHIIGKVTCSGFAGKIVQFHGDMVSAMNVSERITLCNMVSEAGAFSAIIDPYPEEDIGTDMTVDISGLTPQIALPHHVDNVSDIGSIEGTRIDQVFIGSCTNGRYEDFVVAAGILRDRRIAPGTRMFFSAASEKQLKKMLESGIVGVLVDAGGVMLNPGCSLCFGSCQGLMFDGENLLSTGNRNYKGRVGSPKSSIYLASPATAAYSAIKGFISNPQQCEVPNEK